MVKHSPRDPVGCADCGKPLGLYTNSVYCASHAARRRATKRGWSPKQRALATEYAVKAREEKAAGAQWPEVRGMTAAQKDWALENPDDPQAVLIMGLAGEAPRRVGL